MSNEELSKAFYFFALGMDSFASVIRSLNKGATMIQALRKELDAIESCNILYDGQAFGL